MRPATYAMSPGDTLQVVVEVKDQFGSPFRTSSAVAFASSRNEVATVSRGGVVTAISEGSAGITATVTEGDRIRGAFMTTTVIGPALPELLLHFGSEGWQPSVAQVTPGGLVRWFPGSPSGGVAHTTLYLLAADYRIVDSLDLSSGPVTRRFQTPGTVRYCSGGCWDPPEFGTIYVR